jgi:hypothetical protein
MQLLSNYMTAYIAFVEDVLIYTVYSGSATQHESLTSAVSHLPTYLPIFSLDKCWVPCVDLTHTSRPFGKACPEPERRRQHVPAAQLIPAFVVDRNHARTYVGLATSSIGNSPSLYPMNDSSSELWGEVTVSGVWPRFGYRHHCQDRYLALRMR